MNRMQNALIERLGYSEQDAAALCTSLEGLDQQLVPVLQRWLETGKSLDAILYHGHSIDSLCADYGMNFIAAILTLDWLIKEPDIAMAAIEQGIM